MNKLENTMQSAGFKLPIQKYKKTDPRGSDHGFFTASWTECSGMEVTKYTFDKKIQYSMFFGCAEDFESWASDCT